MQDDQQTRALEAFIKNVLWVAEPEEVTAFLKAEVQKNPDILDEELYTLLLDHSRELRKSLFRLQQIIALKRQREVIGSQTVTLLGRGKKIDGYLEIGTSGTYVNTMKDLFSVKSPVYVVNERQALGDYLQAFSWNPFTGFRPYDDFHPLRNYDPLSASIDDNSVEVVTCYIGLHHIPQDKILPFLQSIYRVLKPGGKFVLRDHNVTSENLYNIVYAAHFVFNALMNGEDLNTEKMELRNFQSLDYWISKGKTVGFDVSKQRLLQDGDPTLNTLVLFTKPITKTDNPEDDVRKVLGLLPEYERDFNHTFLSGPEWHIVDMTDEYNRFIVYAPFYEFPFFSMANSY